MLLEKLDIHLYKTETTSLSLKERFQNNSKGIKDHNIRPETLK
jgi:hypothetical protein